ncbi:ABC transporter substrate-binding protein [Aliamphritea hakodatensis]|uniref:ABC transporter substrate-binding protein n=1 Tax=Aliamphritea hakodatensis TaxID=2895352 RepID=UPI0022FDAB5C|nr:ABC transporter substrate-binding protein [Aliamphritea hakodatensis]
MQLRLIIFLMVCVLAWPVFARDKLMRLYIDADNSISRQATESIYRGMYTALKERDFQIEGYRFEIVIRDHRGNSSRSKANLEAFLKDDRGLLIFSGLHSPPLLANQSFINRQKILLLDPWAAAAPITRSKEAENWIYRLSVDDSKAGEFITAQAVDREGFSRPYLLLENTGWGRSNENNMLSALAERGLEVAGVSWFNWSLGQYNARSILRQARDSGADVIFLVANAPEGKVLLQAMADDPSLRLPVRSHWGITGGDFALDVSAEIRRQTDLKFIQTRFSFLELPRTPLAEQVLQQARDNFSDVISASDIKAPAGFIHAYDLTRLMIAAIEQAGLSGDVVADRAGIRAALNRLQQPVEGLIKTYRQPFSVFTPQQPDAHEALGPQDLRMARYNGQGNIILESE